MIQNNEYRTSTKQRIVIAIIAFVMLISTAALYFGIIVSYNNNGNQEQTGLTAEEEIEYQQLLEEYQLQVAAQAAQLSDKYFEPFNTWRNQVKAFNGGEVTTLTVRDLKEGDGREIDEGDYNYSAYYIGWLKDGTIFDSSLDDNDEPTSLVMPLEGSANMIEGWVRGIVGMRIGGVRLLTIPSELGYGEQGSGSAIPPDSPLKFIVMLVESPEEIEIPARLWELYERKYGSSGL